jgi:chloramphenicol-sensitive protein RarD
MTDDTDRTKSHATDGRRGVAALIGAFTIWGLMVLYLRLLGHVPAPQIIVYRAIFCCVFVLGFLRVRGELHEVRSALAQPAVLKRLMASAALISLNWLTFTWSINSGHIVEASLGYFINPLVNVVLGVALLGERLRRGQWFSVSLAATGVLYLTWLAHAPPWIALVLALSFGGYGLIRKTVGVGAMAGLGAETLLCLPFGLAYLAFCEWTGVGVLRHADGMTLGLLVMSGLVTAVPLWLFSYGARLVPYSTVGVVQYIGPTIQFLIGVFVTHEPFDATRAVGFGFIWAALLLYAVDGLRQRRAVPA